MLIEILKFLLNFIMGILIDIFVLFLVYFDNLFIFELNINVIFVFIDNFLMVICFL